MQEDLVLEVKKLNVIIGKESVLLSYPNLKQLETFTLRLFEKDGGEIVAYKELLATLGMDDKFFDSLSIENLLAVGAKLKGFDQKKS